MGDSICTAKVTPVSGIVSTPPEAPSEFRPMSDGALAQESAGALARSTYKNEEKTLLGLINGGIKNLSDAESKNRVRAVGLAGVIAPFDKDSSKALKTATRDGDGSVRKAAWKEIDVK
jgi:hypothetical protein